MDVLSEKVTLKRALSRTVVTFYGLGTILGAGIYVLVGKVAAEAGFFAPLAFLLALVIAFFTAVSYAELSSRLPKSAGEAVYVQTAFNLKWLSTIVGWLVVATGIISAAAISRGFVGYMNLFVQIPAPLAISLLVIMMGIVAIWGIEASAAVIIIITVLEIGGLILVLCIGYDHILQWPSLVNTIPKVGMSHIVPGVVAGAFIAFYAFIGFEDMVNVVEEIKNPKKNLPFAIFMAVGLAGLFYILVALVMVTGVPLDALAKDDAPLALLFVEQGYSTYLIGIISLVSIINGALVQVIMASRVVYGMAQQGSAPRFFSSVNSKTQTPIAATLLVCVIILSLALGFDITQLAKFTSSLILCVFITIHLALLRIKYRGDDPEGAKTYSRLFPWLGASLSILFLLFQWLYSF